MEPDIGSIGTLAPRLVERIDGLRRVAAAQQDSTKGIEEIDRLRRQRDGGAGMIKRLCRLPLSRQYPGKIVLRGRVFGVAPDQIGIFVTQLYDSTIDSWRTSELQIRVQPFELGVEE